MSQPSEARSKVYVLSLLASALVASSAIAGAQPGCIPTVFAHEISYTGLTSGCSNQPGNYRACLAGEAIVFSVAVAQAPQGDCPISYIWQFENGPVFGLETTSHMLPIPGTYTVQVSIYDSPTPVVLTRPVTVVSPSAVPTLNALARVILIAVIALCALYRVR